MAPSRHDWKIVDWDVKPQHKQTKSTSGKRYLNTKRMPTRLFYSIDLLYFYRKKTMGTLFGTVTLYLAMFSPKTEKNNRKPKFFSSKCWFIKIQNLFFFIRNNIYPVLLCHNGIWVFTDAKWYVQMRQYRMRVLLFVTRWMHWSDWYFRQIMSYISYQSLKNVLLQRVIYLSQNSECFKWPIITFAECPLPNSQRYQ